jgi:hypothetical protein
VIVMRLGKGEKVSSIAPVAEPADGDADEPVEGDVGERAEGDIPTPDAG